jgi:hypothetical protein
MYAPASIPRSTRQTRVGKKKLKDLFGILALVIVGLLITAVLAKYTPPAADRSNDGLLATG